MTARLAAIAAMGAQPSTLRNHKLAVRMFLAWLVNSGRGHLTVAGLTIDLLRAFFASLEKMKNGKPRDFDTRRRIVEKIEAAWAALFEEDWHHAIPKPRALGLEKAPRKPVTAPSFAESAMCVAACVSEGPRRFTTLLYYTGLRYAQVRTLDWSQVDLVHALLTVPPHKGLPGRVVPMSPHLVEEMKGWGEQQGLVVKWSAVPIVQRRVLREAWARAGVREGAWRKKPAQAFRIGLTSGLKRLGVDVEDAEYFVGRGIEGARERYIDPDCLPLRQCAAKIPPLSAANVKQLKLGGM